MNVGVFPCAVVWKIVGRGGRVCGGICNANSLRWGATRVISTCARIESKRLKRLPDNSSVRPNDDCLEMGKVMRTNGKLLVGLAGLVFGAAAVPPQARATWSIVMCDERTKEVAIASATCLLAFDLQRNLPVVLVEVGAAAAQSQVDALARNRIRIRDQFLLGTAPADMLPILDMFDGAHQNRQYGIVDTQGRTVTFTGANAGAFADGVIGQVGDITYAIQGNVITGMEVITAAENAVINTPGDIPAKLMAAMEAARSFGGDGRCSCGNDPVACGAPPAGGFERSAHIAFYIVSRRGDTDDICASIGCARGDYFMNFNIINSVPGLDPVLQMQMDFDAFRAATVGQTDQVQSTATFRTLLPPSAAFSDTMQIALKDWAGDPITGSPTVEVLSDPRDGSGLISAGAVQSLGNGMYEVAINSSDTPGMDRIAVRVTDTVFDRILTPSLDVIVQPHGDMNGDGVLSVSDIGPFVTALTMPKDYAAQHPEVVVEIVADFNADAMLTVSDIGGFVSALIAAG